jgi:hypothetical protein
LRFLSKEFVEHCLAERFHQGVGGQLIRNVGPKNDYGAAGKVGCRLRLEGTAELLLAEGRVSCGEEFRDSKGLRTKSRSGGYVGGYAEGLRLAVFTCVGREQFTIAERIPSVEA